MAAGGVSAGGAASAAAGALLLWSGIKGVAVTQALRDILSGAPLPASGSITLTAGGGSGGTSGGGGGGGGASGAAADAMQYDGAGYVWGGAPAQGKGHWDCSSFANWVYGHDLGLAIPGYAAGKYTGAAHGPTTLVWLAWSGLETVSHSGLDASPGDLAIWPTHMGIVTGSDQMISAQDEALGTGTARITGAIPEPLTIRRYRGGAANA